jgi:hypothetical protein
MINFTYIMTAFMTLGIILACIPKKTYSKGQIDWRMVGVWVIIFAFGIGCVTWMCYLIYTLVQFIWPVIIMMWGENVI